jgi:hypothetical protein
VSGTANSGPAFSNSLSATRPAENRGNRAPVLLGLGALALVLVAVLVFLATRDNKKDDGAKQNPPPVNPTPPTPPTPGPDPKPNPTPDDKFAWPAPARADFGLKVELTAPAARKDADGKILMTAGTPMTINLRADKDCRVSVWFLDPSGHPAKLFPNDDDPDDRLIAGKERVIPGNNAYILETTPTEGAGTDRLRVIATTGEQPAFPAGAKSGRFTFYNGDTERERLASTIRGVVIKKTAGEPAPAGEVSEAELPFRVQK